MDRKQYQVTAKRIFSFFGPYKLWISASFFCAFVTVGLSLYVPVLTGRAIDCITGWGQVDFGKMFPFFWRIGVCGGVIAAAQWSMNQINNRLVYRMAETMRTKAFERLEILPLPYLDSHDHGDLLSRVVSDIDQLSDGLLMGAGQLFTGVLTIFGTLVFLFLTNAMIAGVVVFVTPLSLLAAGSLTKRTYRLFQKQSKARGELTSFVEEMLGSQKVVQAFGQEERTKQKFERLNEEFGSWGLKAVFFSSITNPVTRFVNGLVFAGVGIAGAFGAVRGLLTVGQLSAFLSYANQYTRPFNEISGVLAEFQNALACAGRVFELLEAEQEEPDKPDAKVLKSPRGEISMEQVSFSYDPKRPLIEDLTLFVKPGMRIALVGPTGCGKSTFINLLMRFYDVNSGSLKLDGADLRRITRKSLRTSYGMVLQESWLKTGTIWENIAYGKPHASREEIVRAAKEARAHSFILRMPKGYDTEISEDGGNLSQGQKQLLCIARVMLCLPPLLILDEATSSIDTRTEISIQKAFGQMTRGRTSFIAAHRLSTVKEADLILVMKDGQIVEQGKHEELLSLGGFYTELYNSQFAKLQQPVC